MKHWLVAALICFGSTAARAQYFNTIVSDPQHPKLSAKLLYTSKLALDGGVTDVALVYHKASLTDCLWPEALLNAGFPPVSWTLLEAGAGGDRQTGFVHIGASVNIAPTILGPLTAALNRAGGNAAKVSVLLVSPNGSGLNAGFGWKSNVIQDGGVTRLNEIRFSPRFSVGYTYQF